MVFHLSEVLDSKKGERGARDRKTLVSVPPECQDYWGEGAVTGRTLGRCRGPFTAAPDAALGR